jgi:hypothetical protein
MELKINNQKQFRPDSLLFSLLDLEQTKRNSHAINNTIIPKQNWAFTFQRNMIFSLISATQGG